MMPKVKDADEKPEVLVRADDGGTCRRMVKQRDGTGGGPSTAAA